MVKNVKCRWQDTQTNWTTEDIRSTSTLEYWESLEFGRFLAFDTIQTISVFVSLSLSLALFLWHAFYLFFLSLTMIYVKCYIMCVFPPSPSLSLSLSLLFPWMFIVALFSFWSSPKRCSCGGPMLFGDRGSLGARPLFFSISFFHFFILSVQLWLFVHSYFLSCFSSLFSPHFFSFSFSFVNVMSSGCNKREEKTMQKTIQKQHKQTRKINTINRTLEILLLLYFSLTLFKCSKKDNWS